eukprot:SAG11_NODE_5592_length_1515_cov_1.389124_2_plen_32_part_01
MDVEGVRVVGDSYSAVVANLEHCRLTCDGLRN